VAASAALKAIRLLKGCTAPPLPIFQLDVHKIEIFGQQFSLRLALLESAR